MQRLSITRRFFTAVALAIACAAVDARQGTALPATADIASAAGFRPAPQFAVVFLPRLHRDAYTTWVSPAPLDQVLRRLDAVPALLHPPGSWQATPVLPFDAFGDTGSYDRFRLARLYGPARVMAARGPVVEPASPGTTWTLFSPYPDPALDHLERGTLLIILTLPGQ